MGSCRSLLVVIVVVSCGEEGARVSDTSGPHTGTWHWAFTCGYQAQQQARSESPELAARLTLRADGSFAYTGPYATPPVSETGRYVISSGPPDTITFDAGEELLFRSGSDTLVLRSVGDDGYERWFVRTADFGSYPGCVEARTYFQTFPMPEVGVPDPPSNKR